MTRPKQNRRDSKGHYTPENCRIVSVQINARNKKSRIINNIISAEGDKICIDSLS